MGYSPLLCSPPHCYFFFLPWFKPSWLQKCGLHKNTLEKDYVKKDIWVFHPTSTRVIIIHPIEYFIIHSVCNPKGKKKLKWNQKEKIKMKLFQIIPTFSVKISFLKYCERFYLTNAAFLSRKLFQWKGFN